MFVVFAIEVGTGVAFGLLLLLIIGVASWPMIALATVVRSEAMDADLVRLAATLFETAGLEQEQRETQT